jgi:hypothetical protein
VVVRSVRWWCGVVLGVEADGRRGGLDDASGAGAVAARHVVGPRAHAGAVLAAHADSDWLLPSSRVGSPSARYTLARLTPRTLAMLDTS